MVRRRDSPARLGAAGAKLEVKNGGGLMPWRITEGAMLAPPQAAALLCQPLKHPV